MVLQPEIIELIENKCILFNEDVFNPMVLDKDGNAVVIARKDDVVTLHSYQLVLVLGLTPKYRV